MQPDNTSEFQEFPPTRVIPGVSAWAQISMETESLGRSDPSWDDDVTVPLESAARSGIQMWQDPCHLHQGDTSFKGPWEEW